MLARIPYDACPLCKSSAIKELARANCSTHTVYNDQVPPVMVWMSCDECGHVFTDGYFSAEALAVIFSKTNENQKLGHDLEAQRFASATIVEKVLPYAKEGKWLDVGFGNGSLLFTAEEYGFTPVGLDLRTPNVVAIRRLGIEAYAVALSDLQHSDAYSVISMCDVLEHMPFPADGLAAAHRLLKRDGVLFLSMPNMDSILWKVLTANKANPYWSELEHYHNFGRKRLIRLLEDNGFRVLRFGLSERYRACMELVTRKVSE
jgi:2-polyprenyl-3-methyl-5-hydroxy-6-metoxy-1,4-benzoquinol methylase